MKAGVNYNCWTLLCYSRSIRLCYARIRPLVGSIELRFSVAFRNFRDRRSSNRKSEKKEFQNSMSIPCSNFLRWKRGEPRKLFLIVVVRRILHGFGEPGGVDVPWRYDPSPLSCWPALKLGAPPLLATGVLPAFREGEEPLPLPVGPQTPPPPPHWLDASKRWTGRGDGTGEADGVLLLLLLNGWATNPAWWWLPGPG